MEEVARGRYAWLFWYKTAITMTWFSMVSSPKAIGVGAEDLA
jgi:hypothetical protein